MHILLDGHFDTYDLTPVLVESKSLATFDAAQDDIRQAVIDGSFQLDKNKYKYERRRKSSTAKKQFDTLQEKMLRVTVDYTNRWKAGEISKTRWQDWVKHTLRESYRDAFALGLKSAGHSKSRVGVAEFDETWVESAIRHEMKYFNRLLKDIAEGRQAGSIEKRLRNYSEALKNVFLSGRIMGTPSNHLVEWTGPNDRATCNGCRFMIESSPFTKQTLPTTPRAGDTKCLMNCRCRLIMREVNPDLFEKVQKRHRSKRWYQEKLQRLKADKVL